MNRWGALCSNKSTVEFQLGLLPARCWYGDCQMPYNLSPENSLQDCNKSGSAWPLCVECDLWSSRSAVSPRLPQNAVISLSAPVQGFVSLVIEQAFKWDCKLCFDPPRALETTCHITFISLLNCKMILWLRLHFKWCARRASELTHSTFNLTAVSLLGHSAALKNIMEANC